MLGVKKPKIPFENSSKILEGKIYKHDYKMISQNFSRKSKFWLKVEMLVENRKQKFGEKSKLWSNVAILVKC